MLVIPAQAGIQWPQYRVFARPKAHVVAKTELGRYWIPACAGMTGGVVTRSG
jgi:hypothetical protein